MGIVTTYLRAFNTRRMDPYPMEILKRLDHPTTHINEDGVKRVDERESGFNRASRGDFGPYIQHERPRFVMKHPLSGALGEMQLNLVQYVDGEVAPEKAPISDNPVSMAHHRKNPYHILQVFNHYLE